MSLLLRRYAKSTGYARSWFYVALAIGFAGLAVRAIVERDWLVGAIAVAMIGVSVGVAVLGRRLARGLAASQKQAR